MPNNVRESVRKLADIKRYISKDMPIIIGQEGVNHYQEGFDNEGFTDASLSRWKDVKRRDPSSAWYGHQSGSNANRPGKKRRKKNSITNYSPAATTRKTLSGGTRELAESIHYKVQSRSVIFFSDLPYFEVHNSGKTAKIYGKKTFMMPKRKMVGKSRVLNSRLRKMITGDITKIWNR